MQTKQNKQKVSKFGNKYYKDEDIAKVFKTRIPSYTEDEVEDELAN